MYENNSDGTNRRTVLKTSGLALTGLAGVAGSVEAARPSLIERANRILDRTGDEAKWRRFLENHGASVRSKRASFGIPATGEDDDEAGTERYYEGNLDISINLVESYYYADKYYASLHWGYDPQDTSKNAYGQAPPDALGLGFREAEWELYSNDLDAVTYSSDYVSYRSESATGEGMTFDVEDRNIDKYTDESEETFYAGIDIKPEGNVDPSERHVQGGYTFTWRSICFTGGVSAAYPSPAFGLTTSVDFCVKKERTITGDNNIRLRLYQDDA